MTDQFDLERFVTAQEPVFDTVINEQRCRCRPQSQRAPRPIQSRRSAERPIPRRIPLAAAVSIPRGFGLRLSDLSASSSILDEHTARYSQRSLNASGLSESALSSTLFAGLQSV
jgi:hypothetical protein